VVLAAVKNYGIALNHAADNLKQEKDVVLAAVTQSGSTLRFAAETIKADKEVVLAAVTSRGRAIEYADKGAAMWGEKDFVLAMVQLNGMALEHAHDKLQSDKEVILAAAKEIGGEVGDVSLKDAVLAAVKKSDGKFLGYVSDENLLTDKDLVLAAARERGVVANDGMSMKELALAMVSKDGNLLQCISASLRADKDVVLAAATQNGAALKFALEGMNQNPDCLKAAGLFDQEEAHAYERSEKVTLSIKFSLGEKCTEYATHFAKGMKEDEFLRQFKAYNPNAWCKKSCDPKFTDKTHKCRGCSSTCVKQNIDPIKKRPSNESCWRFAFRFHQQESKDTGGFMIQVEETQGLGLGQEIETEMAQQVKIKVFRTYTNMTYLGGAVYSFDSMKVISKAVQDWYKSGCTNYDLENIFIGHECFSYTKRPKFEKL